jgi:hypothetical protein
MAQALLVYLDHAIADHRLKSIHVSLLFGYNLLLD